MPALCRCRDSFVFGFLCGFRRLDSKARRCRGSFVCFAHGFLVKHARKPNARFRGRLVFSLRAYIIPPMPAPAGIAGVSSLIFATTLSVVSRVLATLVAF